MSSDPSPQQATRAREQSYPHQGALVLITIFCHQDSIHPAPLFLFLLFYFIYYFIIIIFFLSFPFLPVLLSIAGAQTMKIKPIYASGPINGLSSQIYV